MKQRAGKLEHSWGKQSALKKEITMTRFSLARVDRVMEKELFFLQRIASYDIDIDARL
jgi:hypothetical protein